MSPNGIPVGFRSGITLKDVAHRAGVSTAAASQALNGRGSMRPETRARIAAVAVELGYAPNASAAALRRGRTMSMGYVVSPPVDESAERRDALARARQLNAFVRESAEHGFTVTVIPSDRPDLVRRAYIDALYLPDVDTNDPLLTEAERLGIPVVVNDIDLLDGVGVCVRTGYEESTRAALDLLVRGGAERIGLLADVPYTPRDEIGERVYRQWCRERGRDVIVVHGDVEHSRIDRNVGELLALGVDAIFSAYQEGPAIYLELEHRALVIPRDVQLIALCLHDCALAERLGVTRVCAHPESAPRLMLDPLLELLSADIGRREVRLPWELVRGSTTR